MIDYFKDIKFPTEEEIAEARQTEQKQQRMMRSDQFDRLCPKGFKDTDSNRLDQNAVQMSKEWADGKSDKLNILIGGLTGVGKTRLSWLILKRKFVLHGVRYNHIGAESFARRLVNEKHLMDTLCSDQILLFDDLGKERDTPTAEAGVFELIRERMDRQKPTIYTTNYGPDALLDRFVKQETGSAICRRLKESSLCIAMK